MLKFENGMLRRTERWFYLNRFSTLKDTSNWDKSSNRWSKQIQLQKDSATALSTLMISDNKWDKIFPLKTTIYQKLFMFTRECFELPNSPIKRETKEITLEETESVSSLAPSSVNRNRTTAATNWTKPCIEFTWHNQRSYTKSIITRTTARSWINIKRRFYLESNVKRRKYHALDCQLSNHLIKFTNKKTSRK